MICGQSFMSEFVALVIEFVDGADQLALGYSLDFRKVPKQKRPSQKSEAVFSYALLGAIANMT